MRLPSDWAVVARRSFCSVACGSAFFGVKEGLHLIDGSTELLRSAELPHDFEHVAVGGNGRDFQDAGHRKPGGSMLDVFVENLLENFAGLRLEVFPEVHAAFAEAVGTLAAGAKRGAKGNVAQEVERVRVRLGCILRELLQRDAAIFERLKDGRALVRLAPVRAKLRRSRRDCADLFRSVVGELDDAKALAAGVEFVNDMGRDFNGAAVNVELAGWRLGLIP
jgi:hypothetical protein